MKIGFVGLGVMGKPMAKHLVQAGYEVVVFDRKPDVMDELVQVGAEKSKCIEQLAEISEIFITMLPNGPDVKEVVLTQACSHLDKGKIVIDMSSIDPTISREIAHSLGEIGVEMLDAPVSGGEPKAVDGTLAFMVGGKKEVFEQCRPILETMGTSVTLCGGIGAGNVVKLCNQIIVALNIAALSEAMTLGQLAGVAPETIFAAIRGGLAGSTIMDAKAPMMMDQDFQPGFRIDLHIKDLNNAVIAAREACAPLPLTSQVLEMMKNLHRDGYGNLDHSALIKFYEKLVGESLHH